MSYILDALKKAEAERNLGAIPDLHARPYEAALGNTRVAAWQKLLIWVTATATVATAVALAFIRPWNTPPVTSPVAAVSAAAAAPTPLPITVAPVTPPAPATATPAVVTPAAQPPTPALQKVIAEETARTPDHAAINQKEKKTPEQTPPPAQQKPAPTATLAPQEPPLPTLRELPDNIQREIPSIVTNGYIYSPNKADRTVLIDQRLLHEGDQIAPGLAVEKLTPNGMVLNYKGYRYRTSY